MTSASGIQLQYFIKIVTVANSQFQNGHTLHTIHIHNNVHICSMYSYLREWDETTSPCIQIYRRVHVLNNITKYLLAFQLNSGCRHDRPKMVHFRNFQTHYAYDNCPCTKSLLIFLDPQLKQFSGNKLHNLTQNGPKRCIFRNFQTHYLGSTMCLWQLPMYQTSAGFFFGSAATQAVFRE